MQILSSVFFFISALIHVLFFILESFLFQRPKGYKYFKMAEKDHQPVKVWAFNQGFYNLFLAIGLWVGMYLDNRDLKLFCASSMVGAGVVLWASAPQLKRGFWVQSIPPLIAIVLLFVPQQ